MAYPDKDNRRNNGSARKPRTGFVGKESPVDLSQALLQGDKLESIITRAVKTAISGFSDVEKASNSSMKRMSVKVRDTAEDWNYVAKERMKAEDLAHSHSRKMSDKTRNAQIENLKKRVKEERARAKELADFESKINNSFKKKTANNINNAIKEARAKVEALEIEVNNSKGQAREEAIKKLLDAESHLESTIKEVDENIEKRSNFTKKTLDSVLGAISSMIMILPNVFTDGIKKYGNAFESTFTNIATRGDFSSRKEAGNFYKDAVDALGDKGLKGAVNVTEDLIPAMSQVMEQGFIGEDALAKAIADAEAKVLMPWLDTTSEAWINLSANLSESEMNRIKGQQLLLKETQGGNRLLQSGVINSLNDEMAPLLTNIDYNTGGAQSLSAEYQAIMQQMVDSGNYSSQEAYATVKNMMDADKNRYKALTEGDTATRLYAMGREEGKSAIDSFAYSNSTISGMAANAGGDTGAAAIYSELGSMIDMSWLTEDKAKQARDVTSAENVAAMTKEAGRLNDTGETSKAYQDLINNANEKVTATQELDNSIEHAAAKVAQAVQNIPHGFDILNTISDTLTDIANYLLNEGSSKISAKFLKIGGDKKGKGLFNKNSGSPDGSPIGNTVKGGFLKKAGSSIAKTLGKSGVGTTATTLVGVGSLLAGAAMMADDGVKAYKKADEWGTSKGSAATAGALLGARDKGLKDAFSKDATKEDRIEALKNTGKQVGKYAAIGAGIGSFIPGVGTAIGGAVGAGVGVLSSIWSGKEVAEGMDKLKASIGSGMSKLGEGVKTAIGTAKDKVSEIKEEVSKEETIGGKLKAGWKALFGNSDEEKPKSHASGLDHVPYDGYLAKLHKGEGVLTANENRILKANARTLVDSMRANNNRVQALGSIGSMVKAKAVGELDNSNIKKLTDILDKTKATIENKITGKSETDRLIDAMRSCTTLIVDAVNNTAKNNTQQIDRKNNLLPTIHTQDNKDMINFTPTAPSNSTIS